MVKVINKSTRRKTNKVYVSVRDSRSGKTRGLTLEGVTLSQAFKAISALEVEPLTTSGTDSVGVQGCTTDKH